MNIYDIYQRSPVFLQNFVCSLYGYKESRIRYSEGFKSYLSEFVELDKCCSFDVTKAKAEKLAMILVSAKESGLYSSLARSSMESIMRDPWKALNAVPIQSKNDFRNAEEQIPKRKSLHKVVTSGTTGKALKFVKDSDSIAAQWAIWFRHRSRFGVQLGDLSVNFTGKPVVPPSQKNPPYWRYNAAQKQYLISMQHINEENISSIFGFLNSIEPKFYSGYPSIIAEVSRLAINDGLKLDSSAIPKVVFTGAEKILDYQRDSIESWLGCSVTDQYGLSEGCCNFSKCEHGNYHEDFEFCHIEIADPETLSDGSVRGRLIGTGFFNHAMPFLKYDTGDIAVMAPEDFQCPCGRPSRVIFSVDGRSDDYVLTPDGRRIMRFDYLFKDTSEVLEAQVVQREPGSVVIRAVLGEASGKESFEAKVRSHFDEYISAPMELIFEYVEEIERSRTGKFKAVVNELPA